MAASAASVEARVRHACRLSGGYPYQRSSMFRWATGQVTLAGGGAEPGLAEPPAAARDVRLVGMVVLAVAAVGVLGGGAVLLAYRRRAHRRA